MRNLKFNTDDDNAAAVKEVIKAFSDVTGQATDTASTVKKLEETMEKQNKVLLDFQSIAEGIKSKFAGMDDKIAAISIDEEAQNALKEYMGFQDRMNKLEAELNGKKDTKLQLDQATDVGDFELFNEVLQSNDAAMLIDKSLYQVYLDCYEAEMLYGGGKDVAGAAHRSKKFAMQVSKSPLGGYWVRTTFDNMTVKVIHEYSPIREFASIKKLTGGNSYEFHNDLVLGDVSHVGEKAKGSNSDTTTGMQKIFVHEMNRRVKATNQELEDSWVNTERYLADKAGEAHGVQEGTDMVSGNGIGKCRGILAFSAGSTWGTIQEVGTGSATTITYPGFVAILNSLDQHYRRNAVWLMHKNMLTQLMLMPDGGGDYLMAPKVITDGIVDSLAGRPLRTAKDLATPEANAESIIYGDLKKGYQVVDRKGMSVLRDPFSAKPFVEFDFFRRVGGDVKDFNAIKIGKCAAS